MASNTKNKYPADKSGTRYSEFRNTKRAPQGKTITGKEAKQAIVNDQSAGKTA